MPFKLNLKINVPEDDGCNSMASVVPAAKLSPQSGAKRMMFGAPQSEDMENRWEIENIIIEGDGTIYPKQTDQVTVHYEGFLLDGTRFDGSEIDKPFTFRVGLGRVIAGWDEGVLKMALGQKCILKVRSDAAYGDRNIANGVVPPNSDLKFVIHLIKINDMSAPGEN